KGGSLDSVALGTDGITANAANVVPDKTANLLDRLTFQWASGLMKLGNEKALEASDIWDLPLEEQSGTEADRFEIEYNRQIDKGCTGDVVTHSWHPTLTHPWKSYSGHLSSSSTVGKGMLHTPLGRTLMVLYRKDFLITGVIRLLNTFIQFLPAVLIGRLLRSLEGVAAGGARDAYMTALALFGVVSVKTLIENQYFHRTVKMGMQVRGVLSAAIYRKSMRLSPSARQASTVGEISNYMQLDAARLDTLACSLHPVWDSGLQILGYSVLLLRLMGPCVLAGIALMVVLIPFNTEIFNLLSESRAQMLEKTDLRVKQVNELLQGIRAIKFYNWELPFLRRIEAVHGEEQDILRRSVNLRSILASVLTTTPSVVIVITLGLYSATGNPLVPSVVFTALSLFNQLRFPLYLFPVTLSVLSDGRVSHDRLSNFLNSAESCCSIPSRGSSLPPRPFGLNDYSQDVALSVTSGTFQWAAEGEGEEQSSSEEEEDGRRTVPLVAPALHGINMTVKKGELVAVVGSVGSGKSSLLQALLGEMTRITGKASGVYSPLSQAYVPQTAWIPNDTLRNNILFGSPYDEERYRRVLSVCRLERDLELLDNGDMTEIGEQGINLSGGQKQRLSIARAVYSNADLYLLDDPLSALDAQVGKEVFDGCIMDELAGKTRILVTNQLQYLPRVDRIIMTGSTAGVDGSTVIDQGTYEELISRGHDLSTLVSRAAKQEEEKAHEGSGLATPGHAPTHHVNGDTSDMAASTPHHKEAPLQHHKLAVAADGEATTAPPSPRDVSEQTSGSISGSRSSTMTPAALAAQEAPGEDDLAGLPSGDVAIPAEPIVAGRFENLIAKTKGQSATPFEVSSVVLECGESLPRSEGPVMDIKGEQHVASTMQTLAIFSPAQVNSNGGLISTEDRAEGAVSTSVYREYFSSAGSPLALMLVASMFLIANASLQGQQWVVSFWTSDPNYVRHSLSFYLGGVTAAAALAGILSHMRTVFCYWLSRNASKRLHGAMLRRVMHAPVAFFDSTPVGRLVQRFSRDIDQVMSASLSLSLSLTHTLFSHHMFGVRHTFHLSPHTLHPCLSVFATPVFLFAILPITKMYFSLMNYFRPVSRELQRLDGITRSPVYAHFGESLGGLTAIRAFAGSSQRFTKHNEELLNKNLATYFARKITDRWINLRLELLGNAIVLGSATLAVRASASGSLRTGLAGLSLTSSVGVVALLNWAVRCFAETETVMTSVERVLYTAQNTPQEAPHHVARPRPKLLHSEVRELGAQEDSFQPVPQDDSDVVTCPDDKILLQTGSWPWEGRLEVQHLSMRYRADTDLVLKNVNLMIRPGEKVGIVGRTGSGKSSLLQALFRMVEPEDGNILIDGVDIYQIGLSALRRRLTIIPQEPVLFSGTVRDNLDPFGLHSDAQVWAALEQASLASTVASFPRGLLETVVEYGENFSAGQRQLMCLARALLRNTRILLLDEATSSVDYGTDKLIQTTIRKGFKNSTVLTIAHRLSSIVDSDKILVMSDGEVKEFAPPQELLADENSLFSQLLAAEKRAADREEEEFSTDGILGQEEEEEGD
ncbi:unnamed protein product, partial [Chrysoparadoxa australica]